MVCYIQQTEVYNSSTFNDRLTITNAESSRTLEEDLNFIRSVILAIYGVDINDSQNKWYKVPFFTLKYLYDSIENLRNYVISEVNRLDGRIDQTNNALNYHINNEFAVEHYTNSDDPLYRGQHKSITARGTLTVYDSSLLKNGLTVEILDPSSNALWVKGKAKIDGSLTVPSAMLDSLNVNLAINAPSATAVFGNTSVSSLTSGGNVSIAGTLTSGGNVSIAGILTVSSPTSLQSTLWVGSVASFNDSVSIGQNLFVSGNAAIYGALTISGVVL